jgi:uncharacterized tellurite resistance protein B-like protein
MNQKLVETLGKIIVAVGGADNELTSAEIENLKDLLFQFHRSIPDPREDAMFEMYTKSPIDMAERERLVKELQEAVWSEKDKAFVRSVLKSMVEADGKITDDEEAVLHEIDTAIESVNTGMLGDLGRLVRGAMQRRSQAVRNAPNREKYFEDFLKNKVYYEVCRRLDLAETDLKIPDEDLRKLSIAGGLMARVAQTDHLTLGNEIEKITSLLETGWGLSPDAAIFVRECAISDVCKDFDYLRMSREFIELTTHDERVNLLELLFAVANADGIVSNSELQEITYIADYLLLSHDRVEKTFLKMTPVNNFPSSPFRNKPTS